jgi:hypothetical protein
VHDVLSLGFRLLSVYRPRCGALKKALGAAAQASLTNALLGIALSLIAAGAAVYSVEISEYRDPYSPTRARLRPIRLPPA